MLDWNAEPNVFYVNEGGAFEDRSAGSGADFRSNARSAVYTDFDRDGDLDVAVTSFHGPAVFLRNELATKQITIVELETRVAKAYEDRDEYASKYQNLQQQLIALKKQRD